MYESKSSLSYFGERPFLSPTNSREERKKERERRAEGRGERKSKGDAQAEVGCELF